MKWHCFRDPLTPYQRVSHELLLHQHAFEIAFFVYDKKEEWVEKVLIVFQDYLMKYRRPGGLNNRNLFSYSLGG